MTKIQEVKILPEAEKKADVHFVFQIAIATSDMEGLLNNWKNLFNIDDSAVIKRCTKDLFDRGEFDGGNYYGSPCQFFIKYCRFDLGNMDIEIIEPLDKNPGNPYSDFLMRNGGKSGIQHIAVRMADREGFKKTMSDMGIVPMQKAVLGKPDENGFVKDCYFYDLLDQLGVILEIGSVVVGPMACDPRAGNPKNYSER